MNTDDIALPVLGDERVEAMETALFARIADERRGSLADALAEAERARVRAARRGRIWMGAAAAASVVAIAAVIGPQLGGGHESAISTADQPVSAMSRPEPFDASGRFGLPETAAGSADDASAGAARGAAVGRDIVTSATATVRVADTRAAADAIAATATAAGGYVESLSLTGTEMPDASVSGVARDGLVVSAGSLPPSGAWITLRVPADGLAATVESLGALGEVTASQVDRRDVTSEAVDLRARVASLETSVTRLTELMGQSASTSDLIAAESALSQRQAELESLRQQLAFLDGQVDMSTLTVNLVEKTTAAAAPDPAGFGDGLAAGWNGLIATLNGVVIGVGFLLPWLGVAAVVAVAVWAIRVAVRRRRQRPSQPPSTGSTTPET